MSSNIEGVGTPTPTPFASVIEAAGKWRDELIEYIAPHAVKSGDDEDAAGYESESDKVDAAITAAEQEHTALRALWDAVQAAAPVVHGMAPADPVWGGMTCTEAEAVAGIFGAAGRHDVADFIIEQHGLGDDDPDDTHHETYLEGRA